MTLSHQASEQLTLDQSSTRLDSTRTWANTILARINRIRQLEPGATVLDIGAAQGRFLIACAENGFVAVGVEPWDEAREVAYQLAQRVGVDIDIRAGVAESLPFVSESCDLAHARFVIEHVDDPQAAFKEACRVLKPGGVFWFSTTSSMCPRQKEIAKFPLFGWYPNRLKLRIMEYAKTNRPHLIGFTEKPANHWFTPWKARRMLRQAGFSRIYDRWDLRVSSEGGKIYQIALKAIQSSAVTKTIADVFVPDCSYAAIK